MKILLINNFHYRRGGSEAVYFNTAEALQRAGHEVVFFSTVDARNQPCEQAPYFVPQNSDLPRWKGVLRYFYNREAAHNLDKLLQTCHPDIVHVHLFWGGLSPSILGVLHRHHIPVVHTAHDYRMVCPAYTLRNSRGEACEKCRNGAYLHCLTERCAKGSLLQSAVMTAEMCERQLLFNPVRVLDGVIFVSRFSRDKHRALNERFTDLASTVIYNYTPAVADAFRNRGAGKYYLFVGRLSREKGAHTLIKAFLNMPQQHLLIVGAGPEEEALRQLAGAATNIVFGGYRTGDDLHATVADARAVIIPSECYENNPMTVIEAYAAGVPVLGAHIGGIPEIVEDARTGYLFTSGSAEELAVAVRKMDAADADSYAQFCANAEDFAARHFSEAAHLTALLAFYQKIIQRYDSAKN